MTTADGDRSDPEQGIARQRPEGTVEALRRTVAHFRRIEIGFQAAGIAYYLLISVVPLAIVAFAAVGLIAGEAVVEEVLSYTERLMTDTGQELVRDALENARGLVGATLTSIAALVWGALRLFRGIDVAFARVYGVDRDTSFLGGVRDAVIVLPLVVLALVASVAIATVVPTIVPVLGGVLGGIALFVGLALMFLPLYVVLPEVDQPLPRAVPGAVVAAGGWLLLQYAFRVYVTLSGDSPIYGVLGGALVFVFWLYLGAVALLTGAVVNAVLAGADR